MPLVLALVAVGLMLLYRFMSVESEVEAVTGKRSIVGRGVVVRLASREDVDCVVRELSRRGFHVAKIYEDTEFIELLVLKRLRSRESQSRHDLNAEDSLN
ncbi:MAG: hypothetical protein DRJ57_04930 [Thermoprotei archaeon]|nr:MAG: hypothetical protein DRJ57_04930 [Thermoprotei archaeon]